MKIITFSVTFLFALSLSAQILTNSSINKVTIDSPQVRSELESIIEEGIQSQAFPGANVLVAKDGAIVFHEAYGYWTYDSLRAVQRDDIYDYASVTKISSALLAVMKLHGEGRFDLDAPLKAYFPKMRFSNKAKLTFREMLAHQAQLRPGIVHWQRAKKKNGKFKNRTFKIDSSENYNVRITDHLWLHHKYKKKMYKAIKKSKLLEEKKYTYSGLLFYLLPQIVENITGEDYETYLQRNFYDKIGASTITYNPLQKFPLDRIVPTEKDTFYRHQQVQGIVHDEGAGMMGGVSANAGLFSTIEDLAKLSQLFLNEGKYDEEQLIEAKSIEEFTRYQYPDLNNRRGLGFDKPLIEYNSKASYVAESASPESYGHSGYTGTFVWIDPKYDLIFILFTNRVQPYRSHRKLYELDIRPRLQQVVYDAIVK
ncbi:MAG: serine hydrolase [Bacteroidota bacterium]